MSRELLVLYDETCGFCCACARWLNTQPALVRLHVLARGSARAQPTVALLGATQKAELFVIDELGGVYRGTDAWLMSLWALRDFREWALRLSSPALRPLAESMFAATSVSRAALSKLLGLAPEAAACDDACEVPTVEGTPYDRARTLKAAGLRGKAFVAALQRSGVEEEDVMQLARLVGVV